MGRECEVEIPPDTVFFPDSYPKIKAVHHNNITQRKVFLAKIASMSLL